MDRKPTLKPIELPPIDFDISKPTPPDADDLRLPESSRVPRPIDPRDGVHFPLIDRIGFAVRSLFRGKVSRAFAVVTGATDPTQSEVTPTMFEGLLSGFKDWKTTILGFLSAGLALLARFGVDPGIDEGTMQTISTIGSVIAGGVLIFIKSRKKKPAEGTL
jgi:hypothetical protein